MHATRSNRDATPPRFVQGSRLRFVESFLRDPLEVGSLWPSSSILARAVVDNCDIKPGDTVVELGPGTGAFTEMLSERLHNLGHLIAVEISRTNIIELRRHFPDCEVIHGSAEHLPEHLGERRANCIVSGLAWGTMRPTLQDRIFNAVLASLAEDGQFVAFGYAHASRFPTSLRFRKQLLANFKHVERTRIVWRNLPPAFIYRCWREEQSNAQQNECR